jgi:F-type H+-transporting ATPase subunit delta
VSNARLESLAATYAQALLEAAEGRGGRELLLEIGETLDAYGRIWSENRDLRAYFLSGFVPEARRLVAFDRLFADTQPLFQDFVRLLVRRGRGRYLGEIAKAYRIALDRRLGRVAVVLRTALPVPDDVIRGWLDAFRARTGQEPVFEQIVDPDLIAGGVLRVGESMADGSVQRRLTELVQYMAERGKKYALQS